MAPTSNGDVAFPDSVRGVDTVTAESSSYREEYGRQSPHSTPIVARRTTGTNLLIIAPPHLGRLAVGALTNASTDVTVRHRPDPDRSSADPFGLRLALRDAPPVNGALLIAPPDIPLGATTPGPIVNGIPVGVLRAKTGSDLANLPPQGHPVRRWAVLAMGKDRYLAPASKLHARLADATAASDAGITVSDWCANITSRPALCARLASGPALAIYLGHGRPNGWAGYQALRWRHVRTVDRTSPIGAVLSIACDTLTTPDPDRSPFGERFVHSGRAGAFLGAVSDVRTEDVALLARTVGASLVQDEPATVGSLLCSVYGRLRRSGSLDLLEPYRLAGSPIQSIR